MEIVTLLLLSMTSLVLWQCHLLHASHFQICHGTHKWGAEHRQPHNDCIFAGHAFKHATNDATIVWPTTVSHTRTRVPGAMGRSYKHATIQWWRRNEVSSGGTSLGPNPWPRRMAGWHILRSWIHDNELPANIRTNVSATTDRRAGITPMRVRRVYGYARRHATPQTTNNHTAYPHAYNTWRNEVPSGGTSLGKNPWHWRMARRRIQMLDTRHTLPANIRTNISATTTRRAGITPMRVRRVYGYARTHATPQTTNNHIAYPHARDTWSTTTETQAVPIPYASLEDHRHCQRPNNT